MESSPSAAATSLIRWLAVATLIFILSSSLLAATPIRKLDGSTTTTAEVDAKVASLMKAAAVPGFAIATFNNGRVTYLKAYGFRDTEKRRPLTVDTAMSAASFTKVAFAYTVMKLVEQGKLDLDRPVYQYLPKPLPSYPGYEELAKDERYKRITARILLSHTSGFANLDWLEPDRKVRIHFDPGSRYAYSGQGLKLLQIVVEAITAEPLDVVMQRLVFTPLGMTRTSMVWEKKFDSDFANGYDEHGQSLGPQKRTKAGAAGSMITTISDFSRFVEAVLASKGLKKQTRDLMLSPQIQIHSMYQFPTLASETTTDNDAIHLSYGLGWGLFKSRFGNAFFKEGHDDGWRNYALAYEEPKSGVVFMSNSSNAEGIFKYLLEIVLGQTDVPFRWESYTPYDQLPSH
jgi:CubicO group peptidase (beta-lactamase class C family)